MIWDAIENIEYKMYDVDNPYEILWDKTGDPYIITQRLVYFPRKRCVINAYNYQDLEEIQPLLGKGSLRIGHRFDAGNLNWLIL